MKRALQDVIDIVRYLPVHGTKKYGTRPLSTLKERGYIVIHHEACGCDNPRSTPWDLARYHVQSNGWPGIGYHSVVTPDGLRWKVNNDSTLSYHVKDYNTQSIGICGVGDFTRNGPTREQLLGMVLEVIRYQQAYGIPIERVVGHGDLQATACPGHLLDMQGLRDAVQVLTRLYFGG